MYIYFLLAAFAIISFLFFPHHIANGISNHPAETAHIWLSTITFSLIFLAALQALLLYIQDQLLHRYHHLPNLLKKLPALENMERLLFATITLGFILLTVVCISSIYFFSHIFQPPLLEKTLLAFMTWVVFLILLLGRYLFGWRGRKAVIYTLMGFVLLIVVYFISRP